MSRGASAGRGAVLGLVGVLLAARPLQHTVEVTTDGSSPTVPASSGPFEATFFVRNTGTFTDSYDLWCAGRVNLTCDGIDITYLTLGPGQQVDVMATYTTTATLGQGRLVVGAIGDGNPAVDSGYYRITVVSAGSPGKPGVALRNHNGDRRDRSLCLTAGAGDAAASQCGDLLVSHGLPGHATKGRERSLTLLYGSAQAVPRPTVVAWVTLPSGVTPADSVYAELQVNGAPRASAWYHAITGTKQIALSYDASADASGLYPIALTVRHAYATGPHDSTVFDTVLVVNRSQSRFGVGWYVAGVEALRLNQPGGAILWLGGDGSATVYRPLATDTFVAAAGAFRDTLVRSPATGVYTRTLRHRVQVQFDSAGRHLRTVNRIGDTTAFAWTWDAGAGDVLLTSITVPPGGAGTEYRLTYAGGVLDALTDPAGRVLQATVTGGRLVSLTDPDTVSTSFGYDAAGRMTGRTNRRGFTTAFTYAKGLRVTQVRVPLAPATGDTALTQFVPWDEQGLAVGSGRQTAADTTASRTQVLGPRVGVADDATFWVDRWGAPIRIQDALGGVTAIARGDTVVPALATRVQAPDGRITASTYDAQRAHPLTITDSTFQGTGTTQPVTTRYVYADARFPDSPTEVRGPVDTLSVTYDTLGLPSENTAPGGHRTGFVHVPSGPKRGLLSTVTEYSVPAVDTVSWTETNVNLVTTFDYDSLGNLAWIRSPKGLTTTYTRDASTRVRSVIDPAGHRTDYAHTVLNWVDTVTVYDDAQLTGPMPTRYHYTPTGQIDSVTEVARGVTRTWLYDAADRLTRATDDVGKAEYRFYDAGGLLDSVRTRNLQVIRHTYDVAGRLTQTTYPANLVVPGSSVPGDTIVRTYDAVGRLLTATSRNAIDSVSYNREGSIRTERQIVRADDKSITFEDTLHYWYDVGGRRVKFYNGMDSLRYTYGPDANLAKLTVAWMVGGLEPDSFLFTWDALGRRDRVQYTNGTDVTFGYDRDGHLRLVCAKHPGGASGLVDHLEQRLRYRQLDADGQVIDLERRQGTTDPSCAAATGNQPELYTGSEYDGRHQLLSRTGLQAESYQYDASGNLTAKTIGASQSTFAIVAGTNRLLSSTINSLYFLYTFDGNGNRVVDHNNAAVTNDRKFFYNAIGQLVGDSAYWDNGTGFQWLGSLNMFRYDARGRRVKAQSSPSIYLLHDGDNVVRAGGGAGQWRYVQGPGVDDPLVGAYFVRSWTKYYYLTDGRGRQLAFTDTAGADQRDQLVYTRDGGSQAGGITAAHGFDNARSGTPDGPRLSFYRNRYYDQETGRWTQEDPIGLAGGANLYRYAGNNPANYTDPFGMCPKDKGGDGKTDRLDDCPEGSAGWTEHQKAEQAKRAAAQQRQQQCYERNKFSSAMGTLTGSEGIANVVDVVETGSFISVGADVVATLLKATRAGVGGASNPWASGFNMVGRPIARAVGRAISGDPAVTARLVGGVTAVGDKVSPTLLLVAAGTATYNTITDAQCRLDVIQ